MMYLYDYYLLLQEFISHPVKGTLILIGIIIALYLLYLFDKKQEEKKTRKYWGVRKQSYHDKGKSR